MRDIVENRRIASARGVPMCQDTGMVIVFLILGQDVHLVGGDVQTAIADAVRQATKTLSAQVCRR